MNIKRHVRITTLPIIIGVFVLVVFFSSCSGNNYLNAIPAESQMLIRLNTTRLSGAKSPLILKTLLHVKNVDATGIDLSQDV